MDAAPPTPPVGLSRKINQIKLCPCPLFRDEALLGGEQADVAATAECHYVGGFNGAWCDQRV
jgi:hypothetical protein